MGKDEEGIEEVWKGIILAEDSLAEHGTWWETFTPNFSKFGEIFVIFESFGLKTSFFARRVAPPDARLWLGHLLEEKFTFLDFSW